MNRRSRVLYLDLLRIAACFLVVMIHVSAQLLETMPSNRTVNFYNSIALTGMALFVMMSGALALRDGREDGIGEILLHKTVRFYFLYYAWKVFYQVVDMIEIQEPFTLINIKNEVVLAAIMKRGVAYHLWFLPMIAVIYMFVPLIRKSVADRKVCLYFLSVFFIVHVFWATMSNYEFRFDYVFQGFFEYNPFELFGGYLGYFILGHFLFEWGSSIPKVGRILIYILGGGSLILSYFEGSTLKTPFSLTAFFMATALFLLGQRGEERLRSRGERAGSALFWGASCTLGIYLLHPFALSYFPVQAVSEGLRYPALSIPVMTLCIFLLCGVFSALLLKVPVLRKLVQ
ncbi:MAG: acyltransferase family protein [Roseburia sp.]|nr:acyltransferase family protein [Roseburia sp.]